MNKVLPDNTLEIVANFPDSDNKIIVLVNRKILDETIQRNWAMSTDNALYKISKKSIFPHAHSLERIRTETPKTDFYWIIDADEIYDPETIPGVFDFLRKTKQDAVLVRGYNFFKKWNFKLDDNFWQIGFLRPGRYFYSRRGLYFPKALGWVHHLNPKISTKLIDYYCRQAKLPESIGHFYHGAYVGDDERIRKKMKSSSHAREHIACNIDQWFEDIWKKWHPGMRNFRFGSSPEGWQCVEDIAEDRLPKNNTGKRLAEPVD